MTLDLGTGDGRAVLARAAAQPDTLVIGVDADVSAMADASRKAASPARKGGLANALFVAAAAERLPAELDGRCAAVTVTFPWGSLLRGVLHDEAAVLAGIARICRPGATVTLLLSVTERDHVDGVDQFAGHVVERLVDGYAGFGLALVATRPAEQRDIAASHSSWAKRLGAGHTRPAWLVQFRKSGPSYPGPGSEGRVSETG